MKFKILIITLIISLSSCGSNEQNAPQIEVDDNSEITKDENSLEVKEEYTPNAKVLAYKTKKSTQNSEQSDAEQDVFFYIDDVTVAKFKDFGEASSDEEGLYLASDISQKSYLIEIVNNKTIKLRYETYFEGEQSEVWVRTYIRENDKWKQSKCDGECK